MKKLKTVLFMILAVTVLGACSYANTEPDEFACAYGGGLIESKAQKGDNPIEPSSGRQFIGMMDDVVYLPASIRNYVVDKDAEEGDRVGVDYIRTPSSDGVQLDYEISIRYRINYENGCKFWDETGKRFDIDTPEGWSTFLEQNLRPVLENGVKAQSQRYEWEDIWRNRVIDDMSTWDTIQQDLGVTLVTELNRSLGGEYLCGVSWKPGSDTCPPFEVLIKSAIPVDADLTQRYSNIQAEQAETERVREVKARELEAVGLDAERDLAEANAQLEVSRVEAEKAIIDAQASTAECTQLSGIGVDCTLLEAARNGSIDFWVVDGENRPVITAQGG